MARIKEFDRDKALNEALILFWRQGYTATSVQQLLDVMYISRSSLYSEYGNKRDLFIEVLSLYNDFTEKMVKKVFSIDDPRTALTDFYEAGFDYASDQTLYRGCLLVNTVLELKDVDDELSLLAAQYLDNVEKGFVQFFERCLSMGSLSKSLEPKNLAAFFMTVIKGMRVVSRQKTDEEYLRGVIETALLVLDT